MKRKKTAKKASKIARSTKKAKNKRSPQKSKIKKISATEEKPQSPDKMFLQKMIENLLPQMAEKILSRAQSMGQILKKRKIK